MQRQLYLNSAFVLSVKAHRSTESYVTHVGIVTERMVRSSFISGSVDGR